MDKNSQLIKVFTSTVTLGLVGVSIVYIYSSLRKRFKRNQSYVPVGSVKKILIYPIKSLKPIECDQVSVDSQEGLFWNQLKDRSFVLINEKNVFITQRQLPELVLLDVQLTQDNRTLRITSPDGESITLPLTLDEDLNDNELEIIQTRVWNDDVKGVNCGPEVSRFFSNYLDKPNIRLLRFVNNLIDHRPSQVYLNGQITQDPNIKIMYQDSGPVSVINDNAIEALNSLLTEGSSPVNFSNFRPNILISAEPFDEDNWEKMMIGSTQWRQLKKCTRCVMTTVDTEKGIFMKEPMVTLKKHRKPIGEDSGYHSPLMGVFFKPETSGTIKIGDPILATYK